MAANAFEIARCTAECVDQICTLINENNLISFTQFDVIQGGMKLKFTKNMVKTYQITPELK